MRSTYLWLMEHCFGVQTPTAFKKVASFVHTVGPRISSNKRCKLVGMSALEPPDRPNGAGIDSGARINLFGMVLDGFRSDCDTLGASATEK